MSFRDASSSSDPASHLYPQAIQLKLYQAFIFSIPVLFSIILFLLFYLFYLKRRSLAAASASTYPSLSITTAAQSTYLDAHSLCQKGLLKEKLKEILPSVLFNEDLQANDIICCVCLGEFEKDEELIQIPVCKHIFHLDCIHHWLYSHSTCPLCRCSVYHPTASTKLIVVGAPSSLWQSVFVGGPDHNSQIILSVNNLQPQDHVIEVGDSADRGRHLEFTDSSHGQ